MRSTFYKTNGPLALVELPQAAINYIANYKSAPLDMEGRRIKPAKTKKPAGGKSLRAAAYDRNPLLTFLATHGLFHDKDKPNSHKAEFSPDKAIMVMGYGPVFKKTGKRLDELTQNAIEEGYLPTDGTESQLRELVRRAVAGEKISPLYAEGVAEQIAEQNFAEHLAQQQEAAQNEDFDDPFGPMLDGDFVADDFDVPGYDEASDPIKLEVNALLALADDAGINEDAREAIKEDAHYATLDQSEQAFYEAYRNALKDAIAASNRVGSADSGEAGNAQGSQEGLTAVDQHNKNSVNSDDFISVLNGESVGGNAGAGKAGVNVSFDDSGRIASIGNTQDLPAENG